ncbi:putative serine/threonine-protein kinase-like protein CCR3 [Abrus precatorius]|uniref:non-specific serine/threonine protein kinase n=1 Tax=Abrus precatorius TaxID=3816 RepID=A0A8B8K119_ABRPR|nr:putative serine/threonine-protein kinase-like protein CCR3 [Abrus precatorius]
MTPFTLSFSFAALFILTTVNALGSAATTAVTYGTATVCGVVAGETNHHIQCYQNGKLVPLTLPNVSFQAISGGRSFFCGIRSGGYSLHCWDTNEQNTSFCPKRLFHSDTVQLTDVTVGDAQVCAREVQSGVVRCWRGNGGVVFPSPGEGLRFGSITSGCGFSCGVLRENGKVLCWGDEGANGNGNGGEIQRKFENLGMSSLVAGVSHVCGLTLNGVLVCNGNNGSGQLGGGDFGSAMEFSGFALGADFTCGIRRNNGFVVCWGGFDSDVVKGVSFESIVAGLDFVCGLTTRNLSVLCWGPGWGVKLHLPNEVPLGMVLPGPCVEGGCGSCGTYPDSDVLCHGSGSICYSCQTQVPLAVPLLPQSPQVPIQESYSSGEGKDLRELLAFFIVGSVGAFAGLCTIFYLLWIGGRRFLRTKVDNSVQPTSSESDAYVDIVPMPNFGSNGTTFRSFSSKRQSSGRLRRHRSASSSKHVDRTESFSLCELAIATSNFSVENKIGAGSFGSVYKGKLADGREVAIKRGDTSTKKKKFQEKEIAFDSELALLSRLHHKHLVRLIGFCEENDERLLVYEYMSNGSLYDHLHDKNNIEKSSSILNSWKMRIKIALDAARGIEYIHNYAVPPIIHRDIKSSNILLDSNWNARVSDFGLSLIWPETEQELMSTKAVGTVGYIDPEYYVLNVLTTKSDVYGLGVVMLELLTGKRAVFKTEEGSSPIGVVEYTGPKIASGELWSVLDYRVGQPEVNEVESIEIMAYTAMHCVNLEGKERPDMTDIVANLERALAFIEGSPGSLSIASFSAPLE